MKLVEQIERNKRMDEMNGLRKLSLQQVIGEYIQIIDSGELLSFNEKADSVVMGRYQDLKTVIKDMIKDDGLYRD